LKPIWRQKALKIILTRDPVCAGDDADSPHQKILEVTDQPSLREFVKRIVSSDYLPKFNGRVTWVFSGSKPLAVVAEKWKEPKILGSSLAEPQLQDFLSQADDSGAFHFSYMVEKDPDVVFEILERVSRR
jgi:hypothetical protein